MSLITGTGSKVNTLYSGQHSSPSSIDDNPSFTSEVLEGLLRDCDKKRRDALVSKVRKTTNLYRRVSTVSCRNLEKLNKKHNKTSSAKCLVCLITLVKSSKDQQRAGIKLRCQCNVRVCTTCFKNNPEWYLTKPHFTKCPTLRSFICTVCACFEGSKDKVCCVWMCSRCSVEHQNKSSFSKCSRSLKLCPRRETRTLWCRFNSPFGKNKDSANVVYDEEKIAEYRDLIRSQVYDRVGRVDTCLLQISEPCSTSVSHLKCAPASQTMSETPCAPAALQC